MTTLESMVRADLICPDMSADTKKQVIDKMAALLKEKNIAEDAQVFAKSVLKVGVGISGNKSNGIALASGTSDTIKSDCIALAKLSNSVAWDEDGEPVDIVVLLAARHDDMDIVHLDVLDAIDEMLEDITVVSDLYNMQTPDDLAQVLKFHLMKV